MNKIMRFPNHLKPKVTYIFLINKTNHNKINHNLVKSNKDN